MLVVALAMGAEGNHALALATAQRLLEAIEQHFEDVGAILAQRQGKAAKPRGGGRGRGPPPETVLARCDEALGLVHLLTPGGLMTRLEKAVVRSVQRQWTLMQTQA